MALVQKNKLSLLGLIFGLCLGLFLRSVHILNEPCLLPEIDNGNGQKSEYSVPLCIPFNGPSPLKLLPAKEGNWNGLELPKGQMFSVTRVVSRVCRQEPL